MSITVGNYRCFIEFIEKGKNAYGMVIKTGEDELMVAGVNLKISFFSTLSSQKINIGRVLEEGYNNQQWNTYRYLNGDETWHNSFLVARGRSYLVANSNGKKVIKKILAPIPVLQQNLETNLQQQQVDCPGIYKVKFYEME